ENGTIQPGSEIAGTYGNATPITTAGQTVANITNSTNACTSLANSSFLGCITEGFIWFIKSVVLNIVGFFLWMSANLLNFAMYHGVFEFKKFAPDDIYNIWLVVRQIISLFVFFTGLFVGFMAIIGKSEEFKKYIAFLVVFGLFVNFSYPIVRVFVDVSNVVSLQIYQTALGKEVLADNPSGDSTAGGRIMNSLGLQGLVASATSLSTAGNNNGFISQVTSLPGAIAVVGFVGYAAYIFFMAAFLIIVRTALLVCIIIASPILLVDTIVPALGEKAKWLRGMFVSQLFVAPVFTIMLALTLKFLAIFSANNTSPSALSSTGTSSVTVFFNLIMMLVMLHIMLKVTKAVAGGVGDTVTNWAGKAGGLGTGLALGAGAATFGFATRNTVGRFAKNMGDKDFGGGVLGNLTKDAFKGMGGAKYDLRNLSATGAIAGTLGITGMGKGAEKGYDKNREDYEKETYERASEIKDDGEREGYLKRKFNTSNFAKFTGTASQNAKAYSKFIKEDDDVIKQYVNSDEDGRKKLSESEKNTKFLQRFGNVDKYYDSRTTEEEKNMLKARMSVSTQKAVEEKSQQDDGTVESYINSNETQRARMAANAKNKNLKSRFEDVDKYYDTTATPEDRANIRGRIGTDDKRALNDNDKRLAEKEADKIIKTAQLSAAQATKTTTAALVEQNVSTSQQTNSILNQMVAGNNDIADLLRTMIKTSKSNPTQTTSLSGGALIGNNSDSLYQDNNEGDSENILTPQLSPKKEAVPAE
ncbi:MAG: hypothetical protein NTW35_03610, partial [Candidatus Nomurabacteria bacterium]|nr:hypothetical protein [Candidatus Nomurabacteria bacterium]